MTLAPKEDAAVATDEPGGARRHAFFGSLALSVVAAARMALQIAVLPILARLLGPGAIGLVSLAMPFILFANLLADAGLGAALVRQRQPSPAVESTVFWFSVVLGVLIAASVCLAAPFAAQVLRQPTLTPILIALSPILLLCSSLSVSNSRISRSRRFALFAIGDLISLISSTVVAILAARAGLGPWSLVAQQLVLWGAKAAWVLPTSRFWPRLIFQPRLARDLLTFGLNNVGANIADFVGKSSPALIIGGQLGVVAVGQYAIAYQLVRAPEMVFSAPLVLATFTAVAGMVASRREPAEASLRALRLVIALLAPLFVGLALVSDLVVQIFLGPKWQGAGPVLALLAPAGFFLCAYTMAGAVLMGLGRSDLQFRLSLVCGVGMVTGAALGARFGLDAAVVGVAVGAAAASPFCVAVLARQLRLGGRAAGSGLAWPFAATLAMAASVLAMRRAMEGAPHGLQLAASVLAGGSVFAAVLAVTWRRQLREDISAILPRRGLPPATIGTPSAETIDSLKRVTPSEPDSVSAEPVAASAMLGERV